MSFLEIKADLSVSDQGEIKGIAWPFGSPDRVGDMILKGAFQSANNVPMLWAHDQSQPIGVWNEIKETPRGLEVSGKLLINDIPKAKEAYALIKEGAISGLSIGFQTKSATPKQGGGRYIKSLNLFEISFVSVPCHPGAQITSIKENPLDPENIDTTAVETKSAEIIALEEKIASLETETKALSAATSRLDKIEARLNRPAVSSGNRDIDNGVDFERKAFGSFVRRGVERMPHDEVKALTVANDASAGYLAPAVFSNELIKLLRQFSPVRQYARVVSIGAPEIKLPRRVSSTAATWVAETDDRTATSMSFEQLTFQPYELATYVDVSNQLLEDNAYNLEGELASDLAESFGITESMAFLSGDGVGKPKGLLNATGIATFSVSSFSMDSTGSDLLIDMYHKLPSAHAQNAVWILNRDTLAQLRKVKNSYGDYIIQGSLNTVGAMTLLGRPVVEMVDMPNIGSAATPIVFGDLQGYRIVDRVGLSILRDPYTLATKGQMRIHARKRVGGDVTHPDRFVKLTLSA
ncbi:phage major capsid protein [Beijerinckia mobilis]|uniref:phage major capsid protein n=1 Tax=Beijerinckia mobilis TaxID=231434 RepID=UPI0005578BF9|nr:phage major capsid protein [Beijerinckia mobilis]